MTKTNGTYTEHGIPLRRNKCAARHVVLLAQACQVLRIFFAARGCNDKRASGGDKAHDLLQ